MDYELEHRILDGIWQKHALHGLLTAEIIFFPFWYSSGPFSSKICSGIYSARPNIVKKRLDKGRISQKNTYGQSSGTINVVLRLYSARPNIVKQTLDKGRISQKNTYGQSSGTINVVQLWYFSLSYLSKITQKCIHRSEIS